MFICICNGITDQDIITAVEEGAETFEALQATLGVATCCGKCADIAKSLLPSTGTIIPVSTPSGSLPVFKLENV